MKYLLGALFVIQTLSFLCAHDVYFAALRVHNFLFSVRNTFFWSIIHVGIFDIFSSYLFFVCVARGFILTEIE